MLSRATRSRPARPQQAPDHRLWPAQPVPLRRPPRHQRAVGRGRGLEHLGGDQPGREYRRCHRRELRLAVLRGQWAPKRLRRGKPAHLRDAVPGERRRDRSDVHLQPFRQRGVGRRLPDRWLVDGGHRVLSRIRWNVSGGIPRRALLRRLHPELHLVDGQGCRTASRIPRPEPCSSAQPRGRSTSKSARTARSTTSGSAAPSAASSSPRETSHRPRSPRPRRRAVQHR